MIFFQEKNKEKEANIMTSKEKELRKKETNKQKTNKEKNEKRKEQTLFDSFAILWTKFNIGQVYLISVINWS